MKTPRLSSGQTGRIAVLLLSALFLIGCGLLSPAGLLAGPVQPSPTGTAQPAGFDLTAGLAALHSYHVEFSQTDQGSLNGSPYQVYQKISRSYVPESRAEDTVLQNLQADGKTFFLHYIRIGGAAYFQTQAGGACQGGLDSWPNGGPSGVPSGGPDGGPSGAIPNPAEILPPVSTAQKVGAESLEGLAVTHYHFDDADLGLVGQSATGEMWIADQDGLVVKYQLDLLPPEKLTGKGLEVHRTIQYALSAINAPDPISLPAACSPVLMDIPALSNAVNLDLGSGWISYTTASTPTQAADFYDKTLAPLGWARQAGPLANPHPEYGLFYLKDGQTLSISFYQGEGGLSVSILLLDPTYALPEAAAAGKS